jgi:phage-related tail protein
MKARKAAKDNAMYKQMKAALASASRAVVPEDDAAEDTEDTTVTVPEDKKKEEQRSKRQLLKAFRTYTARQGRECRFKGWSKRAAVDMSALCKKLKEESKVQYARFRAGYREVYNARKEEKKNSPEYKAPIVVEYDNIWDVDDIHIQEI